MSKHHHQHDHAKPHPHKPQFKSGGHVYDAPRPAGTSPDDHGQPPTGHSPLPTAHSEAPANGQPPPKPHAPPPPMETSGCAMRLLWMFIGNGVLGVSALEIARNHEGFFSLADLVFWFTVPALVALRYVDITRFKGTTAAGQPATLAHWKRYVMMLIPAAVVMWAAAHGFEKLLR